MAFARITPDSLLDIDWLSKIDYMQKTVSVKKRKVGKVYRKTVKRSKLRKMHRSRMERRG